MAVYRGRSTWSLGGMDFFDSDLLMPAILGFIAGLLTVTLAGNWLRFVYGLRTEPRPVVNGRPKPQHRILGFPILAFAHPIPWLWLGALPSAAYYFVWEHPSQKASCFFSVLGAIVLLWLLASFVFALYVQRRKRSKEAK